jgi:hypothetical protein
MPSCTLPSFSARLKRLLKLDPPLDTLLQQFIDDPAQSRKANAAYGAGRAMTIVSPPIGTMHKIQEFSR